MNADFDLHRFEAHLEHFDNPNAGEAGNNFRAALKMCKDAELHFIEACKKLSVDAAAMEKLRSDLQERKTYADKISQAYDAAENRINALQGQLDARLERESGLSGFFAHAWGVAGFRLCLAGAVFQTWFWWPHVPLQINPLAVNVTASSLGLFLLWEWIRLEYLTHGFVQLLMRGLLFLSGLVLVLIYIPLPVVTSISAALLTLLCISKFTQRLASEIAELTKALFENSLLSAVKGWLV